MSKVFENILFEKRFDEKMAALHWHLWQHGVVRHVLTARPDEFRCARQHQNVSAATQIRRCRSHSTHHLEEASSTL